MSRCWLSHRRTDDLLILAHYHRLLEAAGHAGEPIGVIIGSDEVAAVLHLEEFKHNSWRNFTGRWTTMQAYDREFGFRLDIAVVAADRAAGLTDQDPVVVPALNGECPTCPWQSVCRPKMESAHELTLVPKISWRERQDLRERGVHTRTDLAALDPAEQRTPSLSAAVDHARLAQAGLAVARRRGVQGLVLPRADVEVDVDMESDDGEVYLWGNLVSDSGAPAYVPFHDLSSSLDPDRVFVAFWQWLTDLRSLTHAEGRTFAAYCWSPAETRYLRHYGGGTGIDVAPFIASAQWVDLEVVVKRHLITPDGRTSLKSIAPLTGFEWRDPDAGGAQSMLWYRQAVQGDEGARRRLLEYNTDDVRATLAVRDWLARTWPDLPAMEAVESGALNDLDQGHSLAVPRRQGSAVRPGARSLPHTFHAYIEVGTNRYLSGEASHHLTPPRTRQIIGRHTALPSRCRRPSPRLRIRPPPTPLPPRWPGSL
ncbi:MAG: TM0106 family RecB-like putative nuclease, partial [Euzebya sp.]